MESTKTSIEIEDMRREIAALRVENALLQAQGLNRAVNPSIIKVILQAEATVSANGTVEFMDKETGRVIRGIDGRPVDASGRISQLSESDPHLFRDQDQEKQQRPNSQTAQAIKPITMASRIAEKRRSYGL